MSSKDWYMMAGSQTQLLLSLSSWVFIVLYRSKSRDPTVAADLLFAICQALWTANQAGHRARYGEQAVYYSYTVLLAFIWLACKAYRASTRQINAATLPEPSKASSTPWTTPSIIPSKTEHQRWGLKVHSFSYSYLLVGIPVGWRGSASRWLSVDCDTRALLHVTAADYLQPGSSGLDLRGKLDQHLRSENKDPETYPYAYLVTAPRVLGYSFNPVSFWYLYTAERRLRAMILEVNNTFGERRMYFLTTRKDYDEGFVTFSSKWDKDFHVSPFNDREGSYFLTAIDPMLPAYRAPGKIRNAINLLKSGGQTQFLARIKSTEQPIDAYKVRYITAIRLIIGYGFVGFLTFPRILLQAWKLYFKKGLQVFYRPEVASGSISRMATSSERFLEGIFARYLDATIQNHQRPMTVTYMAPPGLAKQIEYQFISKVGAGEKGMKLQILTPAFYSRLVGYHSLGNAIYEEIRNKTIAVANIELISDLLDNERQSTSRTTKFRGLEGLEALRWQILRWLRCRPADTVNADKHVYAIKTPAGNVVQSYSGLDMFVAGCTGDNWLYRRKVTAEFLGQRIALGLVAVIDGLDVAVRVALVFFGSMIYNRSVLEPVAGGELMFWSIQVLSINLVHIWALMKGLG